jgi:hypothetical protein
MYITFSYRVKLGFYISEGATWNEGKVSEMKIYVSIGIKHTKLILYYIKTVMWLNIFH